MGEGHGARLLLPRKRADDTACVGGRINAANKLLRKCRQMEE